MDQDTIKPTKQVIVWRKDLKVNAGKMSAQVAHACLSFITREGGFLQEKDGKVFLNNTMPNMEEAEEWMKNSFTKVVLGVEDEEELLFIYGAAKAKGLVVHLITDEGRTAFKGVATRTCLAIGPHYNEKIDEITGHLKMFK